MNTAKLIDCHGFIQIYSTLSSLRRENMQGRALKQLADMGVLRSRRLCISQYCRISGVGRVKYIDVMCIKRYKGGVRVCREVDPGGPALSKAADWVSWPGF